MNDEISEEAKKSLANLAKRKAFDRLDRDGAHSTPAMQRRVRALAHERNIPPADFHKLMYKRPNVRDVGLFCEKHKVSYDWLLGGDLAGLQRMTRERKAQAEGADDRWVKFLLDTLETIPPNSRRAAIEGARKIVVQS
jgi:hypothetical protein